MWAAVIQTGLIIVGLIVTSSKNRGYTDRRLSEYDKQAAIFWKHINNRSIHETSMSAELINTKFLLMENKIDNLEKKVDTMDGDMKSVSASLHDFREKMPSMIASALAIHDRRT